MVYDGPLADFVAQYWRDRSERERLTAEREAEITAVKAKYATVTPRPVDAIAAYNSARVALLTQQLEAAGLAVCKACRKTKPDVQLSLVQGRSAQSMSDCMSAVEWFADFARLQDLCADCRLELMRAPETTHIRPHSGSGETEAGLVYTNVYPARVVSRESGEPTYQALIDGAWQPVPPKTNCLPAIKDDHIPAELAEAYKIPPRLDTTFDGGLAMMDVPGMFSTDDLVLSRPDASTITPTLA